MTTRRRPAEIFASHEAWFKDDPQMARKLVAPPAKGTRRYNRAAALAKRAEDLTPPPFDRAAMLDPFGTLLDAGLSLRFFGGKNGSNFAATIDDFDPGDPMRACQSAFDDVCEAIAGFGSTVPVIDEYERIRAEDLGLRRSQVTTTRTETEGYKVDVKALRTGCQKLQKIEESLDTIDIRRRAVGAIRFLVQSCLHSVMGRLTNEHEGQIFHLEFNKDDPTSYCFRYDARAKTA